MLNEGCIIHSTAMNDGTFNIKLDLIRTRRETDCRQFSIWKFDYIFFSTMPHTLFFSHAILSLLDWFLSLSFEIFCFFIRFDITNTYSQVTWNPARLKMRTHTQTYSQTLLQPITFKGRYVRRCFEWKVFSRDFKYILENVSMPIHFTWQL